MTAGRTEISFILCVCSHLFFQKMPLFNLLYLRECNRTVRAFKIRAVYVGVISTGEVFVAFLAALIDPDNVVKRAIVFVVADYRSPKLYVFRLYFFHISALFRRSAPPAAFGRKLGHEIYIDRHALFL